MQRLVASIVLASLAGCQRDERSDVAAAIEQLGGRIEWNETNPLGPQVAIKLQHTDVTDADLAVLGRVPGATALGLRGTHVTDKGLIHVAALHSSNR